MSGVLFAIVMTEVSWKSFRSCLSNPFGFFPPLFSAKKEVVPCLCVLSRPPLFAAGVSVWPWYTADEKRERNSFFSGYGRWLASWSHKVGRHQRRRRKGGEPKKSLRRRRCLFFCAVPNRHLQKSSFVPVRWWKEADDSGREKEKYWVFFRKSQLHSLTDPLYTVTDKSKKKEVWFLGSNNNSEMIVIETATFFFVRLRGGSQNSTYYMAPPLTDRTCFGDFFLFFFISLFFIACAGAGREKEKAVSLSV